MARETAALIGFNRGVVSKYAMARVDLSRMRYAAEEQTNYIPRIFGSMILRPGLRYMGLSTYNNSESYLVPFIRATDDYAILEFTDGILRPIVNDDVITRNSVSTSITGGTFTSSISSWTTSSTQSGASVSHSTTYGLGLTGTGTADAIAYQAVSVSSTDESTEHGIRITVSRGPVGLRIGTSLGDDDIQSETYLNTGVHSLGITPGATTIYIYFFNRDSTTVYVESIDVESSGTLSFTTDYDSSVLQKIRYTQSADVMYFTDGDHNPMQVERRDTNSWSWAQYQVIDGPYRAINYSNTKLTASDTSGEITITANSPTFKETQVGALFRLSSYGQDVTTTLSAQGDATDPVEVTGADTARKITITVSGTWSGKLILQVATESDGTYSKVEGEGITDNGTTTYNDQNDDQDLFYRYYVDTDTTFSGSVVVEMSVTTGSIDGDVRITSYTSTKVVGATVLNNLGGTEAVTTWYEGAWSDYRGWPTSCVLHEGRLWFFGRGSLWGSVSDAYSSFEDTTDGDSAPISRTVGKGPVDVVDWGCSLSRLLAGTAGCVMTCRSDSLDSPLTDDNFNLKYPMSIGVSNIAPVQIDDAVVFVGSNGISVYIAEYSSGLDYTERELTAICPTICSPGIKKIIVQRLPETRIHAVLTDGTVAVFVYDPLEKVEAWVKVETDGTVEDAVCLPSDSSFEDRVIYIVNRTINSSTVRYYEEWALESECVGGTLNKQADSFVTYSGDSTTTLTAIAPHLAGEEVVVWGDGKDLSPGPVITPSSTTAQTTYTVASDGTVTLTTAVENAIIGLPYSSTFKGAKLAYAAQYGTPLSQRTKVKSLGIIAAEIHPDGVRFGIDLDHLNRMPKRDVGATVDQDAVWSEYDKISLQISNAFTTDPRVCLMSYAPRPCRILGITPEVIKDED